MNDYAIVITTINHPTKAVEAIARDIGKLNSSLFLIGDEKSPSDFKQQGATYFDLEEQRRTGFKYAEIAPTRHYARKNIGYLAAIRGGASILIETDDDNIPLDEFWAPRLARINAKLVPGTDWVNIYSYYTDRHVWPRGLPLDCLNETPPNLSEVSTEEIFCPIQQGLANGNPDVDAITVWFCNFHLISETMLL